MTTDADTFPRSVGEAKEHIRQIRRDKGLGDEPGQIGNNASDLESALQVLSHDLYQTSTHFLLELIQNADDNQYATDTPTLSISYSPGTMKIHCNERGFSKRNVEAICRICKSTKSGRSKSAGFVGQKGIGFKAVFKVASVVWISSGHYSFKFDRDGHLGMIAPVWDEFPDKAREGGTSIYLQLGKGSDERMIVKELASYDEKILLFLRRLRKLEISVKPPLLSTILAFKSVMARQTQALNENDSNHAVLLKNGRKKNFFVWRHMATKMPKEPQREGMSSSEVVLAFPYRGEDGISELEPDDSTQSVYAFLPIRNFGFPVSTYRPPRHHHPLTPPCSFSFRPTFSSPRTARTSTPNLHGTRLSPPRLQKHLQTQPRQFPSSTTPYAGDGSATSLPVPHKRPSSRTFARKSLRNSGRPQSCCRSRV